MPNDIMRDQKLRYTSEPGRNFKTVLSTHHFVMSPSEDGAESGADGSLQNDY